jgi:hypothetical protein
MGMKDQAYTTFPLGNDRERNIIGVDVVDHQMEEEVQLVFRACQYRHDVSKVLDTFIVLGEGNVEDALIHGFILYGMGRDGFEKVPDTVLYFLYPLGLR